MIAVGQNVVAPLELRARIADLYAAYDDALGEGDYERWPEFFTEACRYVIIPRESYDLGHPIGLMQAESRGMLADRVAAIRKTTLYAPRIVQRLVSGIVLRAVEPDGMRLAASFATFQTMLNEPTQVFLCGRLYDRVVDDGGTLRFAERVCVTDSTLVPTSLIFPI
ncbi:MAG TPA: aromatic-ring-hydroxylating dioxygenase subunit beta [Stellaceae bacterium]|jgi:3-phenylpropionate/cinnamic acid dioxygenase small subunit|nr:aromatic-ring-hydroxylating dioxygenase subunit beta [Stellaceae bacterium]